MSINPVLIQSLPHLADEARRLLGLQGNCGRVISRFFDRYLPRDVLTLALDLPQGESVLRRALRLRCLTQRIEQLNELSARYDSPVRIAVESVGQTQCLLHVSLATGVPALLRERRVALEELHFAFERLPAVCNIDVAAEELAFFEDVSPQHRADDEANLCRLVAGDFSGMDDLPAGIIRLASFVCSLPGAERLGAPLVSEEAAAA